MANAKTMFTPQHSYGTEKMSLFAEDESKDVSFS